MLYWGGFHANFRHQMYDRTIVDGCSSRTKLKSQPDRYTHAHARTRAATAEFMSMTICGRATFSQIDLISLGKSEILSAHDNKQLTTNFRDNDHDHHAHTSHIKLKRT